MKRPFLLSFSILLFASLQLKAQLPTAYSARLQTVFDSTCTLYHLKGASAAVVVPGMGAWKAAHGLSEAGVPVTTNMLMGIGSNTKTFTATVMLRLQQQGTLDLDDTIGTWIQHPNVNGQITIRQLLNHTSGIFSFTSHPDFTDSMVADFARVWEPEEILQFINAPVFPAGTSWDYSNTNYLIAGMIIEQVTGETLGDMMNDFIITPAGFTNTILFPWQTSSAPVAHVWSAAFNWGGPWLQDIVADYGYENTSMFSMAGAAGAIMSTAEENAMFWSKLISGDFMNTVSMAEMKETVTLSNTLGYGLGIFKRKSFNGRTIYNHGGTNLGFINESAADSISGVGISVLTNQDSISNALVLNIVRALHKVTIAPPTSVNGPDGEALFTIYPNPATNYLHIEGVQATNADLYIYDITGRVVLSEAINANASVNIQHLSTGNYVVRLVGDDGVLLGMEKLVVKG